MLALLVLAAALHLPKRWFGPVGLSLLAAFAHIATQLWLVDVWLLPGASIVALLPLFLSAAWLTGLVNGLATAHLLKSSPPLAESTP